MTRRLVLLVAVAGASFGLACGVAYAAGPPPGWSWLLGEIGGASLGQHMAGTTLYVGAYYGGPVSADLSGGTYVESSSAGNFEFEHSLAEPNSVLSGVTSRGSTPVAVGKADGQNVTPLIVSGESSSDTGLRLDLQSWQLGTSSPSGIDNNGRLRINGIALATAEQDGKTVLLATLPDGTTQILEPAG